MNVTPAQLRLLAGRAEALAAEIRRLCDGVPAEAPEYARLAGARTAAGWLDRGGEDLRQAAGDLDRFLTVRECGIPWGVCPEHGRTLSSEAGAAMCRVCRQTWKHDRLSGPCAEPVTWKVTDEAGTVTLMCAGHVLGARAALRTATFTRLPTP